MRHDRSIHTAPSIHGMGAFEGVQAAALTAQKTMASARFALQALSDEALQLAVTEELRRRSWRVAQTVIEGLGK